MVNRKKKSIQLKWFSAGVTFGLTSLTLTLASISSNVTDDTLIYENLSEIRVSQELEPNFDADIRSLSRAEVKYFEKLPNPYRKKVRRAKKHSKSKRVYKKRK